MADIPHDKPEQLAQIQSGLIQGETILAVYDCTCEWGERPLGRLYGVNMGRGIVRVSTDPDCPVHGEGA